MEIFGREKIMIEFDRNYQSVFAIYFYLPILYMKSPCGAFMEKYN